MCTLVLFFKLLNDYPIIAMENRDLREEKRNTDYAPRRIEEKLMNMYCGFIYGYMNKTWFGINEEKLFICLTDGTIPLNKKLLYKTKKSSRGKLCFEALKNCKDMKAAKDFIIKKLSDNTYTRVNYVIADENEACHIAYYDKIEVKPVTKNKFFLANYNFDEIPETDYDKMARDLSKARVGRAEELSKNITEDNSIYDIVGQLEIIAKDHLNGYENDNDNENLCRHILKNIPINGKLEIRNTKTLSSSIIVINKDIKNSIYLYCKGNPCKNEFIDYSHIFR